jgi:hypothetical protein
MASLLFLLVYLLGLLHDGRALLNSNPDCSTTGSVECISIPRYQSYQWATCLTNQYIQQVSKGTRYSREFSSVT